VAASPGGLIRWPLYMLVPVGFALLAIQSFSELVKRVAYLTGDGPDPHAKPEMSEEERLVEDLQRELEAIDAKNAGAAGTELPVDTSKTAGSQP
jgi:hypothetical protein